MDDEDEQILRLREKVGRLKDVSIRIGEETREQNRFLMDQLESTADSLLARLGFNMNQVRDLARDGHNRIVFYLLGFALFVMLFIYFITKTV